MRTAFPTEKRKSRATLRRYSALRSQRRGLGRAKRFETTGWRAARGSDRRSRREDRAGEERSARGKPKPKTGTSIAAAGATATTAARPSVGNARVPQVFIPIDPL